MKWFPFGKKQKKSKTAVAVLDVNDGNFELQVLKRSYKQPVLVDFWAAWCGPCRQLGPVLERMADEADKKWILAKLNTEYNQRTAAKFQIRSIPAVKMFRNGRVVSEFTGALPAHAVRQFVDQSLTAPAPALNFKGVSDPTQRLKQAKNQLKRGNGFEAYALLNEFPGSPEAAEANQLLPLATFLCDISAGDGLTGVVALDEAYQTAIAALQRRKPGQALESLLLALEVGEEMDTNYTTNVIESLFVLLGENHKLTQTYRPQVTAVQTP